MMKLLLFLSVVPAALCSMTADSRDTRPASQLIAARRQESTSHLARRASTGTATPPLYGEDNGASARRQERSQFLRPRGACMGKPDCMSPQTRENTRNRASQANMTPNRSTRSTGTQTATPPGSPKENNARNTAEIVPAERRVSAELGVAGSGNSGSRRSNSPTTESRDKLAPLSRTTTAGTKDSTSNLSTPGNSRPGSAQSRHQSAASGDSYADSIGMLVGDPFVSRDQRRQRLDGSRTERPLSAGSALPRLQPWEQLNERPKSADSLAPKSDAPVSEQSYGSRRTTQTSDGSAVARWWMK